MTLKTKFYISISKECCFFNFLFIHKNTQIKKLCFHKNNGQHNFFQYTDNN